MTNIDAAALFLRLVGFYWLATGLIDAITTIGALAIDRGPELAWTQSSTFVSLTVFAALAYPLVGAVLLLKANGLAMRWTPNPDVVAPAVIGLSTGVTLLGIYFLVLGIHEAVVPLQRWIATRQFDMFSTQAALKAAVWLVASGWLMTHPRGLSNVAER